MGNPLAYPDPVWALFRDTPRAGRLDPAGPGHLAAEARTPAGRGRLRLECHVAGNVIADSRFQAWGCPFTVASGAWAAAWLVGKSPGEAGRLRAADVAEALEIPDDRAHCALMAEDAVRGLFAPMRADRR